MQPLWRRRGYRKQVVNGRRTWAERFYLDHLGRLELCRIVKEKLLPELRTLTSCCSRPAWTRAAATSVMGTLSATTAQDLPRTAS